MKKTIILLILTFLCSNVFSQSDIKPNIIIILADDMGYGDVSSYNEDSAFETPHIDRLAENGVKFTQAYTSSAVCTPTRYGLLTGRYNWRSTLKSSVTWGFSEPLISDDRVTIADVLSENNYHTAFIGKWHLGWDWEFIGNPPEDLDNPNIRPKWIIASRLKMARMTGDFIILMEYPLPWTCHRMSMLKIISPPRSQPKTLLITMKKVFGGKA